MRRVVSHPVLGTLTAAREVKIYVDGKEIRAREGEPIAAFCGIGQCTDCVMVVNGVPNVRTCITPVMEGMIVETQHGAGSEDR